MKARLENLPVSTPGIVIESETVEEKEILNNIWVGRGGPVLMHRLADGNISLTVAPEPRGEDNEQS
jgi:hypothetical protein